MLSFETKANKQIHYYRDFGRVEAQLATIFYNDEFINHAFQTAELCNRYFAESASDLHLRLDFYYSPVAIKTEYSISSGKTEISDKSVKKGKKKELPALKITIWAYKLNPDTILALMEFGLKNYEFIKKNQILDSGRGSKHYRLNESMMSECLQNMEFSPVVKDLCSLKVIQYRDSMTLAYYGLNNKFYFFNRYDSQKRVILKLEHIHAICDLDLNRALVFDTDSSFYYIGPGGFVTKRTHIPRVCNYSFSRKYTGLCFGKILLHNATDCGFPEWYVYDVPKQQLSYCYFTEQYKETIQKMGKINKIAGNSGDRSQVEIE
ncbi:MAG: hypothetical protein HC905_00550 [Bacteroidales bacterium]|nr:hypothetical protein [Bacteroidales bacterium]